MSKKTYVIHQNNPDDYRVINQNGVKQALTDEPLHNACWDANLAPDGTLYFSVCSELTTHEFAKLCIAQARRYLCESKTYSISEIAYLCGFSDPYYFSRCFKKQTGQSPRAYRNENT